MLIDLLSTANYISFNIKIAQMLGLSTAVYLAEIMNINSKAINKSKINNDYFVVDRNYVTKQTTISESEQLELDKLLIKFNILLKLPEDKNAMKLDINMLASLISESEFVEKDVKEIVKKNATKKSKQQSIIDNARIAIRTSDAEMRDAYSAWINNLFSKDGWLSVEAVIEAQNVIDGFSNHDKDVALSIIKIATINGYRDMKWAVKKYKDSINIAPIINQNKKMVQVNDKITLSQDTIDYLNEQYNKDIINYIYQEIRMFCYDKKCVYDDAKTLKWFKTAEDGGKIFKKQKRRPDLVSLI